MREAMTQPISELTDRMRAIFGLVVEAYLERGQPVGSKALAGSVSLSPASIRGVMQELEERGLLTHPHTSAGRMPTESGLRLFVDGIMQASLPDAERARGDRGADRPRPADRGGAGRGVGGAVGPVVLRRGGAGARSSELRLKQLSFVAAGARAARWRCWSAPTAASRTASSPLDRAPAPAALDRGRAISSTRACPG